MEGLLFWCLIALGSAAIIAALRRSPLLWPLVAAEWIAAAAYAMVVISSGGGC